MKAIQDIFSNREIAIILWGMLTVSILLFMKSMRKSFAHILSILFCRRFMIVYMVFGGYLAFVLCILHWLEVWDVGLLKDTLFWILFVELPLFAKTIEKAKDGHFFSKLIRDNVAVSVFIEFFIGFWSFSLLVELVLIPVTVFVSLLCAYSNRDKKFKSVKRFSNLLLTLWGFILVLNAINSLIVDPRIFFNAETLKSFLLPMVLLILHLPIVYALALYNAYEQIFCRINAAKHDRSKMKVEIIRFAKVNLSRAFAIRNRLPEAVLNCKTLDDLKENLVKLEKRLELRIGDNYMKRSRFYIWACIVGLMIGITGLIAANFDGSVRDLITLNFKLNVTKIKEILTYIFSTTVVISVSLLIIAASFNKKQREDITQIKKFALYELLVPAKRQEKQLMEYIPVDDPEALFAHYVLDVYEIRNACSKVLCAYENLLTTWEQETISLLQLSAITLTDTLGISPESIHEYNVVSFCELYNEKVRSAPQNEKINTFTYNVKKETEKYSNRVKQFCEDFRYCYK